MENEKIVTYQDLENIYVLCMRKAIITAAENAWGEEKLGAYGTFKMHDEANTAAVNAEREAKGEKKIFPITINNKPFERFDFQAVNNTFAHLEPVYNEIYKFYNISPQNALNCTMVSKQLVDLRNKLAHPDPNRPAEKVIEWQKNSVNYMNVIFGLGFSNITDQSGATFYERFQTLYVEYISRQLENWYYLDDFLDSEIYDTSRFLEVCAVNGIKTAMKDGRYLFCTANLEKTIAILKNSLVLGGESANERDKVKPNGKKALYIAVPIILAVLVAIGIILGAVLSAAGNGGNSDKTDNSGGGTTQQENQTGNQTPENNKTPESDKNGGQSEEKVPSTPTNSAENEKDGQTSGNSEIPSHLEGSVTALKNSDKLSLSNKTLYVRVGEYIAPSAATMWQNVGPVYIYSEDTSIALGEPPLIKGVAKGTTFVVVESSLGGNSAYCVVVE